MLVEQEYLASLKKRFGHTKEISKISRHRQLPKALLNAKKRKAEAVEKEHRKDKNRRLHTKPQNQKNVKEKSSSVVKVVD